MAYRCKVIHLIVVPSTMKHQNLKNGKAMLLMQVFPAITIIQFLSLQRMEIHTLISGIAHAQSRARFPCKGAFETSSGCASVVPIHNIYESTKRVTWRASAGREGSGDGRYLVSIEIAPDIFEDGAGKSAKAPLANQLSNRRLNKSQIITRSASSGHRSPSELCVPKAYIDIIVY